MRSWLTTVSMLLAGCAGAPVASAPEPITPASEDAEQVESQKPSSVVAAPTAEPVAPKTCHEFLGHSGVDQWREQLITAVSQRDDERTTEVVRCVDPDFALPLFDEVEEWLAVGNPRQLDGDPEEEWVLELRQHTPITGDGERFDLVWLGVLDWDESRYRFVGSISRQKIWACLMADDLALRTEFSSDVPSPEAVMTITEQKTKSCGRHVDVSYARTQYRVADGKLVSEPVEPPEPKQFTR